jgi:heme-degrading monooxygenase HmoA
MVTERALLTIKPGHEEQFEAAIAEARQYPAAMPGFISFHLHRGVEERTHYMLLMEWESVEAHMEDFRSSPGFDKWRDLIVPHFTEHAPMEHYTPVI